MAQVQDKENHLPGNEKNLIESMVFNLGKGQVHATEKISIVV